MHAMRSSDVILLVFVILSVHINGQQLSSGFPPWDDEELRKSLRCFQYNFGVLDGNLQGSFTLNISMVSNFEGFMQWGFKSVITSKKFRLGIGAGKDFNVAMLEQKSTIGGCKPPRRRTMPTIFYQNLTLQIPPLTPNVEKFDFALLSNSRMFNDLCKTSKGWRSSAPCTASSFINRSRNSRSLFPRSSLTSSNSATASVASSSKYSSLTDPIRLSSSFSGYVLPSTDSFGASLLSKTDSSSSSRSPMVISRSHRFLLALRWEKDFQGKRDWIFASVSGHENHHEFVSLGPRSDSSTTYEIQIRKDNFKILVNGSVRLNRNWLVGKDNPFYRYVGLNMYQRPLKNVFASVQYSSIW